MGETHSKSDLQAEDPSSSQELLLDRFYGTLYGNCIGDAIGLLTEFMSKDLAVKTYGTFVKRGGLEYAQKCGDFHRSRWEEGDWTDDSDQMICILLSLLENDGKIVVTDFSSRLVNWMKKGFPELGDYAGMGLGRTTAAALSHKETLTDPHKAATDVWESGGRKAAANGGTMRTSVLGIHDFTSIEKVIDNTVNMCKVTHADTRCVASCVAVTTAIAFMLQRQEKHLKRKTELNIDIIINDAYEQAVQFLTEDDYKKELRFHMFAKNIGDLKLSDEGKIGYCFKTMGAGFWALRQNDFRKALTTVTMEAGDADTNGAVAGALLGCKLGAKRIPQSWVNGLKHKDWLDGHLQRYLELLKKMETIPSD